jgi:hypothetical protein
MSVIGAPFEQTGRLLRDNGGFLLRSDAGVTWRLILLRVPVDHVEKRVRVTGYHAGGDLLEVEGVAPV